MGIFGNDYPEGHPNTKLYELFYEDGGQYVYRTPGRQPVSRWNLASAVTMANHEASYGNRSVLSVTDPETGTVLWTGEMATR